MATKKEIKKLKKALDEAWEARINADKAFNDALKAYADAKKAYEDALVEERKHRHKVMV